MSDNSGKFVYDEAEFDRIWEQAQPFTMTSRERGMALWNAVNTIVFNDIPGAMVECGVWKGGSAMIIALTLIARGAAHREIVLFDTFAGMTPAGPQDTDIHGEHADIYMAGKKGRELAELVKAAAPRAGVEAALISTGYDMRLIRFVEGDVSVTAPKTSTLGIALLRLDTDFYDSTYSELVHLYPRLVEGGVMIIDDYGHWMGARDAFEEYFAHPEPGRKRPVLWTIDYTGRGAVKAEPGNIEIERYDYLPEGMQPPDLLPLFPYAVPGNVWAVQWPYLRAGIPHIWRSDTRHEGYVTGNASVEEAACLYTLAKQFAGKRGLEIGTHYGWTAAHLLAAGLKLDCVDPALADPQRFADVTEPLEAVLVQVDGTMGYRLWAGFSPAIVPEVRDSQPEPWSFAFIDGNHDGDAPRDDAREVLKHLAPDAMVVFHDLTSPHVEQGLAVFREAGFQTRLIHTMQILGVAWRGNVTVPSHVQDANVPRPFLEYLDKYGAS